MTVSLEIKNVSHKFGKIVIPKDIGEGLFGISFKIKGPKGKLKTTINPIRTLTPRFIQKILNKNNLIK